MKNIIFLFLLFFGPHAFCDECSEEIKQKCGTKITTKCLDKISIACLGKYYSDNKLDPRLEKVWALFEQNCLEEVKKYCDVEKKPELKESEMFKKCLSTNIANTSERCRKYWIRIERLQ